jgi:hypothetical protein
MMNTFMTDTLPAGVVLVSDPGKRALNENLGTIRPGTSNTVKYQVRVVTSQDNKLIENKACFQADVAAAEGLQKGCDLAFLKVRVTSIASANAETNKPGYWGPDCYKIEMGGKAMKYDAPAGAYKVIVKGGTGYNLYDKPPFTGLTSPINPNNGKPYAISHVIVCKKGSTPPATPPSNPPGTPPATPPAAPPGTPPATPPATPPGTPPGTPPTPNPQPPATPTAMPPLEPPTELPNVGAREVVIVALFAIVSGYLFTSLYEYLNLTRPKHFK